jgi:hypothetical protein
MNREELISALEALTNKDSDEYKRAKESSAKPYAPDVAEHIFYAELSKPLVEILAKQPEYRSTKNLMVRQDNGAFGFQPRMAAPQLIKRAIKVSPIAAVDWIEKIFRTNRAEGLRTTLIWGIKVTERMMLADNIEIVPFLELPDSKYKQLFQNQNYTRPMLWPGARMFKAPESALLARTIIEPLLIESGAAQSADEGLRLTDFLGEVMLSLSAIGPCAPVEAIHWFQFLDPDFESLEMGGYGWQYTEIEPQMHHPVVVLEVRDAAKLTKKYISLTGEVRDKLRIALQRLNQSLRRRTIGDKSIELAIALEALLTDQQGENTWKVGLRSARLAGGTHEQQLHNRRIIAALYNLRSATMHHGVAVNEIKVAGQGKMASDNVFSEATKICASVIRAIIERGCIPEWPAFELELNK